MAGLSGAAAGTEGAGRAGMSGIGAGAGAGVCVLATAIVVTRCCARLRSVLRWLTRRLDVRARADDRVAGGGGRRHTESIHQHRGKGVVGVGIGCAKGSIGREQGCRSPVRHIPPCAVGAVGEDGVPWVILFTVCCKHRQEERVRACPTSGYHQRRRRRIPADVGDSVRVSREEGSVACDALKVQGAAPLGVGQRCAGGNVLGSETRLCCASVGQGAKMRDVAGDRVRDARSRGIVPGSRGRRVRGAGSVSARRGRRGRSPKRHHRHRRH